MFILLLIQFTFILCLFMFKKHLIGGVYLGLIV